jgi:hypothetical protein
MPARLTNEQRALRSITEAQHQAVVIDALRLWGWRFCHFRGGWTGKKYQTPLVGHAGWPDLIACRGAEIIALECKREKGVLSEDQKLWQLALEAAGVEYIISRPSDLDELLARLR